MLSDDDREALAQQIASQLAMLQLNAEEIPPEESAGAAPAGVRPDAIVEAAKPPPDLGLAVQAAAADVKRRSSKQPQPSRPAPR